MFFASFIFHDLYLFFFLSIRAIFKSFIKSLFFSGGRGGDNLSIAQVNDEEN